MARKEQHQGPNWWDRADSDEDDSDAATPAVTPRRASRMRQRKRASGGALAEDDAVDEHGPRVRPAIRRRRSGEPEEFRCRHCRQFVVSVPTGGRHRNHCPYCLHSRHVDERMPGDRLSPCGGTMAPVGMFVRVGGEHTLVHQCMDCGVVRHNRIAADDDFDLVLRLPDLTEGASDTLTSALQSLVADEVE
jgi:hypothetical protein